MKTEDLILEIRERFYDELEKKTGWGRIEVGVVFEHAVSSALAHFIELED